MTTNINKQLLANIEKRCKDVDTLINDKKISELIDNCYIAQSKMLTPEGQTVTGKNDILEWYKKNFENCPAEVVSKIEEVNGDGDWAYSRGTYKISSNGAEKESGKMITVWRKFDNEYKIYNEIWNITKSVQ